MMALTLQAKCRQQTDSQTGLELCQEGQPFENGNMENGDRIGWKLHSLEDSLACRVEQKWDDAT